MEPTNRRAFGRAAAIAAAGSFLNLNPRAFGANEQPILAVIGGRNQGRWVAGRAVRAGAVIKTICDIDDDIIAKLSPELETAQHRKPGSVRDFRRVLEDKDIDAVIIAPPDHWHTHMALLACQAGKDVYVEKPLSQTIAEGHMIRDAARKYNRIVQVGTQRRSGEHYKSAAEYAASGKLGKVCLIKAWMSQLRESIGNPPDGTAPPSADYDMWLGPAPKRPFNPMRFHYNWRFFWDYGNTELGNQGVHMLDTAIWGIQMMRGIKNACRHASPTPPASIGSTTPRKFPTPRPSRTTTPTSSSFGSFAVSAATGRPRAPSPGLPSMEARLRLIVDDKGWRVFGPKDEPGPSVKAAPLLHEQNFLDCIKSRKTPNGDVEIGRLSTMLCHLGNISCRLKREVHFDPQTETFGADRAANSLLTKQYRIGYSLPKV